MNLLLCTIAGLLVGGFAGQWARGFGRDRTMYLVMGAAGGLAGGILVIVSTSFVHGAMIFSNLGAILGAVVLILLSRYLGGSRESDATLQRTFRMSRSKSARVTGFMPPPAVAYARATKRGL